MWYVRLLPPIADYVDYYVIATTPYVLLSEDLSSWTAFFERNGIKNEETLHQFMKFGPTIDFWNEYIFYGFCNYVNQAIFLSGLPDQTYTLPCHDNFNDKVKLSDSLNRMLPKKDQQQILC